MRHTAERTERRKKIDNDYAAYTAARMNEAPCDLPGTYVGQIGTAVPPGWQLKPLTMGLPKDKMTRVQRAINLPEPECFCSREKAPQKKPSTPDRSCCDSFTPEKYTC